MSCVYPLDGWRFAKLTENGKRGITFNSRDGFIDQPISVPCGKCVGCRLDRSRAWAVRMHHESQLHERNCFITLTYANAPEAISKRDLQLFIKRLRHQTPIRYFACGEYGERSRRPHYHAVIFGEDFRGGAYRINDSLYSNAVLDTVWGKGLVSVGEVTIQSCCYVARYVTKKANDKDTFHLMSKRPGIGRGWLEKYRRDIINAECVVIDGKELPIPKAYLDMYPDDFAEVKRKRREYVDNLSPDSVCKRREGFRGKEMNYNSRVHREKEAM